MDAASPLLSRRSFVGAAAATASLSLCGGSSRAATPAAATSEWRQWRGPSRDSQITGDKWAGVTAGELGQKWRVPLEPSYSTPIVLSDRVFVTETRDKKAEFVSALHRETGEKLWEAEWKGAIRVPFFAASNGSWIRSSPITDGERLYVGGIKDVIVALDVKDGSEQWRLDCMKKFKSKLPSFGAVTSPLIDGDYLYTQAGGGLIKVQRKTGEVEWRSLVDGGGMYGSSFSSPIIATLAGKRQLLVQTRKELCGVDMESGEPLWRRDVPAFRGMNILTPLVLGDVIFTSSYQGGSRALAVSQSGGEFQVKEVWSNKTEGYMSSPVLIDGHIYMHLRKQRVACMAADTGKLRWTSSESFGKYWSMVANGSQILALDERGDLFLIEASPEKLNIVSRREISQDETWAHLAVAGPQLFVRELNAIAMYQWG